MAGDYALAALSGLFGGLGSGLYKGQEQGAQDQLAQQHLDLARQTQQRMMDQFQQSQYTNIPGNMLSPDMRGGVDPATGTLRVQSHLVPAYLAANERDIARQEQAKKAAALAMAVKPFADQDPRFKALQDALQSGADTTQIAPIFETIRQHQFGQQQIEQGRAMIAPLYKYLGIEMPSTLPAPGTPPAPAPASVTRTGGLGAEQPVATAPGPEGIPRTLPTPQQPGVQAAGRELGTAVNNLNATAGGLPGVGPTAPAPAPGASGYQKPILTFDPVKGTFSVAAHPEPPAQPGTEYVRAINEKQALQRAGVPETDPRYKQINERIDYYKAIPVAPGGNVYGLGTNPPGGQPTGPAVAGGPAPASRPMISGPPPISTPAETQPAADAQSWIKEARAQADKLDAYFKTLTPAERLAFAGRAAAQKNKLLGALPFLSENEKALNSAIGKLGIDWERASGGLRMAASPQMQDRVQGIIGSPTNAATPTNLRTIADMMEQELQQRGAKEAEGGRRPLSAPAAAPAAPATPAPTAQPQGETISRRHPAYQNARKSGLTDQQIQQRYGVTITD